MGNSNRKIYDHILNDVDLKLADQSKDEIRYIGKDTFKKAVDEGLEYRIVGRTRLRKQDEKDKDHDLLKTENSQYTVCSYRYRILKGYIPAGGGRYIEYVGFFLPWLFLPPGIVAAVLLLFTLLGPGKEIADDTPFAPKDTIVKHEEVTEEGVSEPDIAVNVIIPEGEVSFDGTIYDSDKEMGTETADLGVIDGTEGVEAPSLSAANSASATTGITSESTSVSGQNESSEGQGESSEGGSETPYAGQAHLKVVLTVDGALHTLLDKDVDIKNGEIPSVTIDFTTLDFELQPGVYEGTVIITYADGSVSERPIEITIRQSNAGSMDIGYSPDVTVDLASGMAQLNYAPDGEDTHETKVQLILLNGGNEYVLAESEPIAPGDTLTGMNLDPDMTGRLQAGDYDGYLRLSFSSDSDRDVLTDIRTDIDVTIHAQ